MSKRIVFIVPVVALLFSACSPAARAPESESPGVGVAPMEPAERETIAEDSGAGAGFSAALPEVNRLVIKNANLTLVVDDPSKSMDAISRLAEELGGFVVTANLAQTQLESGLEVPHATITIRVPAEKLDQALERIQAESDQLPLNKTLDSQDVTREYTDLQSRLRNLEDAEEQLRDIMDQAVRTEDVLNVYNRLVEVREQIEVIKGQIQYYEQSAALSAISVDLMANEAVQPLTIGGWQPVGVAKDAVQALINSLKVIANIAIWLVIFVLPVLAVLFVIFILPLVWLMRTMRRRRGLRKASTPPAPPAATAG